MDAQAMCMTAMYMAIVAERALKAMPPEKYQDFADFRGGHTGIMNDLQPLAEQSEKYLAKMKGAEFPGVYEYEVAEPFGAWFAENNPSEEAAIAHLHTMIDAFFNK